MGTSPPSRSIRWLRSNFNIACPDASDLWNSAQTLFERPVDMKIQGVPRTIWSGLCFLLIAGCGDGKSLLPVSGSLTIDGKPADGAVLLFFPGDPEGAVSTGNTDASGVFKLRTDGEWGALPGQYTVAITWPDPKVNVTEAQKMAGLVPDPPDLLKGKFALRDKSKIRVTIDSSTKEIQPIAIDTK